MRNKVSLVLAFVCLLGAVSAARADDTTTFGPSTDRSPSMLAYGFNDRPLMPDHGAPLRLYSPIKLGYKLTKYLTRVTFTSRRPGGYWEDQGYPWLGGI